MPSACYVPWPLRTDSASEHRRPCITWRGHPLAAAPSGNDSTCPYRPPGSHVRTPAPSASRVWLLPWLLSPRCSACLPCDGGPPRRQFWRPWVANVQPLIDRSVVRFCPGFLASREPPEFQVLRISHDVPFRPPRTKLSDFLCAMCRRLRQSTRVDGAELKIFLNISRLSRILPSRHIQIRLDMQLFHGGKRSSILLGRTKNFKCLATAAKNPSSTDQISRLTTASIAVSMVGVRRPSPTYAARRWARWKPERVRRGSTAVAMP